MSAETIVVHHEQPAGRLRFQDELGRLLRVVLLVTAGLAAVLAMVLLARRWSDTPQQPLAAAELTLLAAVLGGLATSVRLLWRLAERAPGEHRTAWGYTLDAMLTAGVLGLAAAVSLPRSPLLPVLVLWSVIVSCEGTAWFLRARGGWIHRSGDNRGEETQFLADRPVAVSPVARSASALQLEDTTSSGDGDSWETLPDGVSQRTTRASNEQGSEMIYGIVRCDFAPHQRQQNIHIAFCPPLDSAPQLTVDQVDGPTAGIRTTVVETYGAAIEVKLKAARSDPTSVQIQFYACESPASEATV